MRTVADVLASLRRPAAAPLPAPVYNGTSSVGVGLAVESMKRHTTDEGWQLFAGLEHAGYPSFGHGYANDLTDVRAILDVTRPGVVVINDKREWLGLTADRSRDPRMAFTHVEVLRDRPDIFRLTVLKDAQSDAALHVGAAQEAGVQAWICYYHKNIVAHLAPYVRPEHLIRTYHSVDAAMVPPWNEQRGGCLLSGAVSGCYPLRTRLVREAASLPGLEVLKHPGYSRAGCHTPAYLQALSRYKVALCTSSIYGYALRKIAEATAAGCIVVTDLPTDDVLPVIDGNLVRVDPAIPTADLAALLKRLYREWDAGRQRAFAEAATAYYDYRAAGKRLVADIEAMRRTYPA